ncbi:MAG: IS66 family insertion sequence element accessory protein TnpB [Butyrivibrio sp.]|nr:IS66 family insertion sequence element accessory protein TnpB [Butyrivibrio sp.]
MQIITQCRQSGLSDYAWCNEHGISRHTFYKAVKRLRDAACDIPKPMRLSNEICVTTQDVVPIHIVDHVVETPTENETKVHQNDVPSISVYIGNAYIQIENGADLRLVDQTLRTLGKLSC